MIPFRIRYNSHILKKGGVIAYPTEAVWGLGCDPSNTKAINRLLALKKRPPSKGLILIGATIDHFAPILSRLTQNELNQVISSWPGPVTWVLPHFGLVSPLISGFRETVAIRVTDHPQVQSLCLAFGGPIVSTSANPTGLIEARSALTVHSYFSDQLDSILHGNLGGRDKPTQIRVLGSDILLRDN